MNTTTPKKRRACKTTPSKFIRDDRTDMWLQIYWFVGAANMSETNCCVFLRLFSIAKYMPSEVCNAPGGLNLAIAEGATPIDKRLTLVISNTLMTALYKRRWLGWDAEES